MPTVRPHHYKLFAALTLILGIIYGIYFLYINSTGNLISRARQAYSNGDRETAEALLTRVLERKPDNLDANLLSARIHLEERDFHSAESHLRQVIQVDPNNINGKLLQAQIDLFMCRFQQAISLYDEVEKKQPLDPESNGRRILARAGQIVGATNGLETSIREIESTLQSILAATPGQPEAHLANAILNIEKGNYATAVSEAQVAGQTMGESFLTTWVLGKACFMNNQPDEAMAALDRADQFRKQYPALAPPKSWNMELYLYQGLVLIDKGLLEDAEKRLTIAFSNDPTAFEPTRALVELYLLMENYPRASDELSRNTALLASNPVHWLQLGMIEIYRRNINRAIDILDSLTRVEPPLIQALYELGDLCNSVANYAKAARIYQRILNHQPDSLSAMYNLGTIRIRSREVESAQKLLQTVVKRKPDNLKARLNLALSYRLLEQYENARKEYEYILEKYPNNMNALIGIGLIAMNQGNLDAARGHFQKSLELNPNLSDPLYYLGQVSQRQGRDAEAQDYFEKCLAIDPNNEFAIIAVVEILFQRSAWDQARGRLKVITENPNARMRVLAENALALVDIMSGNRETARTTINRFEKSISGVEPELEAAIRTNQAILAKEDGKIEEAIRIARRVVETQAKNPDAYFNLGTLQLLANHPSEAISSFKLGLRIDPDHRGLRYNLAVAHASNNAWNEAINLLSGIAQDENAPIEMIYSLAESHIASHSPEVAIRLLEPAINRRPNSVDLLVLKAKALIDSGDLNAAQILTDNLVKTYPQVAGVHLVRGIVVFLLGDSKNGETHLRRSLMLNPEDPNIKLNLATLLIATQNPKALLEADGLLKELESLPGSLKRNVLNQKAILALRRSEFNSAREYLTQSLQIDSNQPEIDQLLNHLQEL